MKKIKIIAVLIAVAMLILSFTSCNFVTTGNGTESQNYQTVENSDDFYKKVEVSDKITLKITEVSTESEERTLADVLDDIRPAVVEIYGATSNGSSAGSGVIIDIADSDNSGKNDVAYIITCHHVIEDTTNTIIKTVDGKSFGATLIGSDPKSDIGLIVADGEDGDFDDYKVASWLSDSDKLRYGTEVVAIGNPLGILGGTVTKGIISGIGREVKVEGKTMTLLQTDAAINGGNSGGGLFDAETGALVGIVNAGYAAYAADGLNFAIPSNVAKEKASMLFSTYSASGSFGYIEGQYDFGVEFTLASSGSPWSGYTYYVYVASLDSYGAFYKNGVSVGDVITDIKIGDKSISLTNVSNATLSELTEFLSGSYNIGDEVTVTYQRRGNKKTITFALPQYVYGN